MPDNQWVDEPWEGMLTRYRIHSVLYEGKTPFQAVRVVDSDMFGRMLVLDDLIQTTERDEFIYHEMMTHLPMLSHPAPESVLIVGGGDGGILREVLKYSCVQKAVLVEIDEAVIALTKEHMPMISQGSFDDPRTEIVIADGAKFAEAGKGEFDVIIVDSSDPVGPAAVLFSEEFYAKVKGILRADGIMVRQSGHTILQPDVLPGAIAASSPVFAHSVPYLYAVPTYGGGLFSSVVCSDTTDPLAAPEQTIQDRFAALNVQTRYYTPAIHQAALQLPPYVQDLLDPE